MIDWTFDDAEVEWMTERLANFWDRRLASIAPLGFSAYGRLLHPARAEEGSWVRWAEVAANNGVPMSATSDFRFLALPPRLPSGRSVWRGDPPNIGTLESHQAEHLIEVLRTYTSTPTAVSFALWDGLGWDHTKRMSPEHPGTESVPDPVPGSARHGPRMRIPGRDYLIYRASLEEALVWMPSQRQTPHYWWPKDHAWAVASDVDLPWTVVAGAPDLIECLARDSIIEVLPLCTDAMIEDTPRWLATVIHQAVQTLIRQRVTVIETSLGTVAFQISTSGHWLASDHGSGIRLYPGQKHNPLEDQLFSGLLRSLAAGLHLD